LIRYSYDYGSFQQGTDADMVKWPESHHAYPAVFGISSIVSASRKSKRLFNFDDKSLPHERKIVVEAPKKITAKDKIGVPFKTLKAGIKYLGIKASASEDYEIHLYRPIDENGEAELGFGMRTLRTFGGLMNLQLKLWLTDSYYEYVVGNTTCVGISTICQASGIAYNGKSANNLFEDLKSLYETRLVIKSNKKVIFDGCLLYGFRREGVTGLIEYQINPDVSKLYKERYTVIPINDLSNRSELGARIQLYLTSVPLGTEVRVDTLKERLGSSQNHKNFKVELTKAFDSITDKIGDLMPEFVNSNEPDYVYVSGKRVSAFDRKKLNIKPASEKGKEIIKEKVGRKPASTNTPAPRSYVPNTALMDELDRLVQGY